MRRTLIVVATLTVVAGLVIASLGVGPVYRHPYVAFRLIQAAPRPTLPVPVEGVTPRQLRDTWHGPRSGGRLHQGIDIFARRGTPIISATPGIVATVGTHSLGGRFVRVLGPGGEWHYYAHMERFADVRAGDVIRSGTVIGYVGDSGNARGTPPHLHYGIYRFTGGAMNPYPRLQPMRVGARRLAAAFGVR